MLSIGGHLATTLVVTGYPAEVAPGWLAPLLNFPAHVDIAFHIEPVPSPLAARSLNRQRARLESGRRTRWSRGQVDDPETEAAASDATNLAHRLARGEEKLFRLALYLTVHAASEEDLADQTAAVTAVAESLLMTVTPTTYRALPAWTTTLPIGIDPISMSRTFDTTALSTCFPFTSPELTESRTEDDSGVLYGVNVMSGSPMRWDRFAQDNYNSITIAASGSGKSYLTKLELLRVLFTGATASVIDPHDEYLRLASSVGGQVVALGATGVRLNPFDFPHHEISQRRSPTDASATGPAPADALTTRVLFLHTWLSVLLGASLTPHHKATLDRALLTTYRNAGITHDPRTWGRPAPVLGDLAAVLEADTADPVAVELAAHLVPYTTGSHANLFAGSTTVTPRGHLVVFALRHLPEEVRAPAILLALDAITTTVTDPLRADRHLVVVDEAWRMMSDGDSARFLLRAAKSYRRYWAGLALVTQDTDDVLGTSLGTAIVSNSSTQLLLRQAPQAIETVSRQFRLSHGEAEFLLTAARGEALLLGGGERRRKAAFIGVAAPEEHRLITTDPAELAADPELGPEGF
ncbi:DUF87 domain-containing protein [Streptomyces sp. AJS327]|uniref:VirB4 family type IV secretion system protein n=1 Tax=Streptomyces sp. AJS327 TaxID=2545265 RepID=UPI0015E02A93|nr:DUF87 domain-containing protein [Streptomyces sp. AJS327]MBA0049784.1 DUF87 domain-containing protein [Streptomyces sp. AJS327]